MWRWPASVRRGAAVCIGIRRDRLAWTVPGLTSDTRSQSVALEAPTGHLSQESPELARHLGVIAQQAVAASRVEVVLADEMARYWLMDPPTGIASLEELRQVAQARCSQLFDSDGDAWVVSADWQVSAPFVCVAVPGWLIVAITQVFGTRARIQTVLGVLLGSAAQRLPPQGWTCITGPRQIILLRAEAGMTSAVRAMACEDGLRGEALLRKSAVELRRQCLRDRSSLTASVAWLDVAGGSVTTALIDGLTFDPIVAPWGSGSGSGAGRGEVDIASWQLSPGSRAR